MSAYGRVMIAQNGTIVHTEKVYGRTPEDAVFTEANELYKFFAENGPTNAICTVIFEGETLNYARTSQDLTWYRTS